MIIMIMRNNHSIDQGDILDLTRSGRVSLRSQQAVRTAMLVQYGIEKNPKSTREFNVIAGVS
jgi:hypothetical protein